MKLTVNLGSELRHANISYPKILPVVNNGEVIGEAIISSDGMGEVKIVNEEQISKIKHILELGVGGMVIERQGNLITQFDLKEVFIQFKESQKAKPKNIRL